MPGPYRARGMAAVEANAACERCHPSEAREWRTSRHRVAETNSAYRRAFAAEPSPFCRGCHAPEALLALDPVDPTRPPAKPIADLGVGCVSCHVVEEGSVLASSRGGPEGPRDGAPHGVMASADFGHTGGCASCHEFKFPGRFGDRDADFMQSTVREHASSPAAGMACAACHMPRVDGRRSHAFSGTREPVWLRDSLKAAATTGADGAVVITLRPTRSGHAFPTGDLFRRLEVGAEVVGPAGRVEKRDVRWLARHFEVRGAAPGRQLVRDDRPRAGPTEVELDVRCPDGPGQVRWWVTYQRVAETFHGDAPARATIESEVLLHRGVTCDSKSSR